MDLVFIEAAGDSSEYALYWLEFWNFASLKNCLEFGCCRFVHCLITSLETFGPVNL